MVNLIELPINPIEAAEDTPFLANYFPDIFAEALVPLNPKSTEMAIISGWKRCGMPDARIW